VASASAFASVTLVGLYQRRVPDHVGEHHGDEPAIQLQGHRRILAPGVTFCTVAT
jgi:hypothetical protein